MKRYSIKNWAEYNTSLVSRGSLTIWIDDDIAQKWQAPGEEKRNGHPLVYSDEAILMALTVRFAQVAEGMMALVPGELEAKTAHLILWESE